MRPPPHAQGLFSSWLCVLIERSELFLEPFDRPEPTLEDSLQCPVARRKVEMISDQAVEDDALAGLPRLPAEIERAPSIRQSEHRANA